MKIRALVSGFAKAEREKRRIVMLQAFVDDLGSDPAAIIFILAGFAATVPQWEHFDDEWQRVLDADPPIAYYKNNEAYGLKGEFAEEKGWTLQKRDDKVIALAKVIKDTIPQRFYVGAYNGDYKKYLTDIPARNRRNIGENMYSFLFYQMIFHIFGYNIGINVREKFDLIFDCQGKIGYRALHWWELLKRTAITQSKFDYTPYFGDPPSFKSDLDLKPLQASDLYAGQIGRGFRSAHIIIPQSPPMFVLKQIPGWGNIFGEDYFKDIRRYFLAQAKIAESLNPGSLKFTIAKNSSRSNKPKK